MSLEEDAKDPGFEQFEQFLEEWSRRGFLKRMGAMGAWFAFSGGVIELLEACGGGRWPAPDPQTVVITTTQVFAPFLASHGQYGILPKHVLGTLSGKDMNTADFNKAPTVANGAFKFVSWQSGQQVTLARNESYWAGPALL